MSISIVLLCFPLLLIPRSVDKIEKLVGILTIEQKMWLEGQDDTKIALNEIATNYHWSEQEQAEAIFDHFTKEADPILRTQCVSPDSCSTIRVFK